MTSETENLPTNILKMVKLLHEKGYQDIYIFPGMSPSGMHWRFEIGHMENGHWPTEETIVSGSIGTEGVEWSKSYNSESLCEDFIQYYKLEKPGEEKQNRAYVTWYADLLDTLKENEPLAFYADYAAPHEYLLENAPGYQP